MMMYATRMKAGPPKAKVEPDPTKRLILLDGKSK